MITERFAPSPTGLLHLGHAYSAWTAWTEARAVDGRFLLRMEDLDRSRVRPEYVKAIRDDLVWLGLGWDGSILFQSERSDAYDRAIRHLDSLDLLYRCTCSRRDIREAISAPQEGVVGPDGPIYPGTCRHQRTDPGRPHALRLDMAAAASRCPDTLTFRELGSGPDGETGEKTIRPADLVNDTGDIVLSRRDGAVAYHLAVVVDDAFQQITHVTRGMDLFSATPVHRVLQALLDLPTPAYRHHALVRDDAGRRLAKRDDARAIAAYRAAGLDRDAVLELAIAGSARPAD